MKLQLEDLSYQNEAVEAVVRLFAGQVRNTAENSFRNNIYANHCERTDEEWITAVRESARENRIPESAVNLSPARDVCVEMETGTGKTLVYLRTIFELHKRYGFSKFIILVPSVAVREGVLSSFETFEPQLAEIYGFKPDCFEYDGARLNRVRCFVEEKHPQIMVMTVQSFNTDDKILNQKEREDLLGEMPLIEAVAATRPVIIMDEPHEGMDTDNSAARIKRLKPLCRLRYSATHKIVKNLVTRLTPFESYKMGLVKKIEVLTVAEVNDEAGLKIEVEKIDLQGAAPRCKLKLWHKSGTGFKFKTTKLLETGTDLSAVTDNAVYRGYLIDQIARPMREKGFVLFSNGAKIIEGEQAKDFSFYFKEQLHWLIDTHFRKKQLLAKRGIKCLSLIFIDRVDNYIREDGIIRTAFREQYRKLHKHHLGTVPAEEQIDAVQGSYFAQTGKGGKGEYTDNLRSMLVNREMFDAILRDKEKLLSPEYPVEFIFSHSALGVGWDNPNVFNIATLNQSYSEIKKRQEIGRGLRICVDRTGRRVYDASGTAEGEEINLLTVIPNETYRSFVSQYQSEIEEIYGSASEAAETRHRHKGDGRSEKILKRNNTVFQSDSFRKFWDSLARKTDFKVAFDDDKIVERAVQEISTITIPEHQARISLDRIKELDRELGVVSENRGTEMKYLSAVMPALDIVEEISESTCLSYPTVFRILKAIPNKRELLKNPARFVQEAVVRLKAVELEEMVRALTYEPTGESFNLSSLAEEIKRHTERILPTPQRGLYDRIVFDSELEKKFAQNADGDPSVVCFLKLPDFYVIRTPAGDYNPDWGIVLKQRKLEAGSEEEYYFVVETKGTDRLDDRSSLTETEILKIKCALKHFEALGIKGYIAPVKEYDGFKARAEAGG